MWAVRDPDRYTTALRGSHRVSSRVEVWSDGALLTPAALFTDGAVTDKWVPAGIRRTLELTVPPNTDWLKWLVLPLLELRPYRGIRYSDSEIEECPLGRYPLLMPTQSRPIGSIKLQSDDYYQRVIQAGFTSPYRTDTKRAADQAAELFGGFTGMRPVVITSTDPAQSLGTILEKTRHDAMVDLAKSFSLEITVDREGVPTVADEQVLDDAWTVALLVGGDFGVLEELAVKPDWDKVFNAVSVTSTAKDVHFAPQLASITDPDNPAAPWRIGSRVKNHSSPLIPDADSGLAAAESILRRLSQSAITYSYTCIPDVRIDGGDTIRGTTMTGLATAQVAEITHPLTAEGRQQITTVSTQPDISDE